MIFKFAPVGFKIRYNNETLLVVVQKDNKPSCQGCYFNKTNSRKRKTFKSCVSHGFMCTAYSRRDNNHVIFVTQ